MRDRSQLQPAIFTGSPSQKISGETFCLNSARGGDSCEVTDRSVTRAPLEERRGEKLHAQNSDPAGLESEKSRGGATEVVGPRGPQGPEQEFRGNMTPGAARQSRRPPERERENKKPRGKRTPGGATEVDVTWKSGRPRTKHTGPARSGGCAQNAPPEDHGPENGSMKSESLDQ